VDERSEIKGVMTKEECVHERAGWRTEDRQLMKNDSLDSLHLEGFNLTHKGQWWLTNQGHSSK